jgi:hypothetical protein
MVLGNISAARFYNPYYYNRLLDLQVLKIIPSYFNQYPLLNKPDKAENFLESLDKCLGGTPSF